MQSEDTFALFDSRGPLVEEPGHLCSHNSMSSKVVQEESLELEVRHDPGSGLCGTCNCAAQFSC